MWLIYRAEKELTELLNENQNGSDVDIDAILNDKAKKNQLTKTNVKNLIKVFIQF